MGVAFDSVGEKRERKFGREERLIGGSLKNTGVAGANKLLGRKL